MPTYITDLSALTTPAVGDLFISTDVSDTTDRAGGTDKYITWANILAGISITESQISDLGTYLTASNVATLTNKSIVATQLTGSIVDARVQQSNVTQHQAALSVTESQISDLGTYLTAITGEAIGSLSDVTITTAASGNVLSYNGSAWVNGAPATAGDALVANPLSQFAATTSLQLKNTISNETGSGALVFGTSPTLVTPALGTPASGVLTNATGYPGDSSLVTSGALNSGSITSGFGTIDTGASAISTTGTVRTGNIELGHATDTTLSRTSAGVLAVEGVEITTNSGTQTLTNKSITESQISDLGTYLATTDIDTLGKLNAIVGDATLIDTADARLGGILKVSSDDTTAAYLDTKFTTQAGSGLFIDSLSPGGNESLDIRIGPHFKQALSTGLIAGGLLSIGSPTTTFSISDGDGIIAGLSSHTDVDAVAWTGLSNIAVTNIATNAISFISIDSVGAVIQRTAKPTSVQRREEIILGVIVHVDNVNVVDINTEASISLHPAQQAQDLAYALGIFNIEGNVFGPSGADLTFDKSAGTLFFTGSNFDNDEKNPSSKTMALLTNVAFQYRYQDGTNRIDSATGETVIDPTVYDLSSVATAVASNKWTAQRIYQFIGGAIKLQMGQAIYGSEGAARAGILEDTFVTEPSIVANGLLRGYILVKGNCTDLTDSSRARFVEADAAGVANSGGSASVTSLQGAYNNSTDPEIILTTALTGIQINDAATPLAADLLTVADSAGTTKFLNVHASGIDVAGALTTTGGIEVGHATDTTLARVSAGLMSIEGDNVVTIAATQTLTNKSIVASQLTGTLAPARLGAASIDDIAEIATALKTGLDVKLVTGTAGASTNLAVWNADGDIVDGGAPGSGSGDMVLASVQTNTAAKTFNDATFLLRNVANTFNGSFSNTNTAARVYTLPDAAGTIALTSDLTSYLTAASIDTLAELNAIVADATLIDTADARLSDARTPLAHNQAASTITTGTLTHERGGLEADVSLYAGFVKISGGVTSQVTDGSANWNTAYGWGDHTAGGYLTALAEDISPTLAASLDCNGFEITDTMGGIVAFSVPIDAGLNSCSATDYIHNGLPTRDRLLYWNSSDTLTPSGIDPDTLHDVTFNAQVGTAYTAVLTDNNKAVTMSNAAGNVLTVPPNSAVAFLVGSQITVIQKGAGESSIAAGVGVTINSEAGELKLNAQFAAATLIKEATDTWYLIGSLKA